MTDPSPPELPADVAEMVSAYLDGEASAAEVARIEADPDLLAAVDRLGRVPELLRADLIADGTGDLERQVAVALDAFPASSAGARVVELDAERRRRWYDRVPLGAVAAAAVAIALVGAATQIDTDDRDETATADVAAEAADDGAADDGDAVDAASDAGGGAGTYGSSDPGLGPDAPVAGGGGSARPDFSDTDALANHVREVVGATRSAAPTEDSAAGGGQAEQLGDEAEASSTCDAVGAADLGDAPVLLVLPASVSGRGVTAVVADGGTGRRLVVIDDLTCEVIDDRDL